jgi:hypothetical protein
MSCAPLGGGRGDFLTLLLVRNKAHYSEWGQIHPGTENGAVLGVNWAHPNNLAIGTTCEFCVFYFIYWNAEPFNINEAKVEYILIELYIA